MYVRLRGHNGRNIKKLDFIIGSSSLKLLVVILSPRGMIEPFWNSINPTTSGRVKSNWSEILILQDLVRAHAPGNNCGESCGEGWSSFRLPTIKRKLRLEKNSAFNWPQMPQTETCNRMKNSADEEVTEFDFSRD